MKVLILSSACCIHTRRWCNGLAGRGIDVHLLSQQTPMDGYDERVKIYALPHRGLKGYILNVNHVKSIVADINPDIVNVHYASGYGTLIMLTGIRDYVMSVWGSDVYDFPKKSLFHKWLVEKNLNNSKVICSTSKVMAKHCRDFFNIHSSIDIIETPFGVNVDKFKSISKDEHFYSKNKKVIIGTVKTLRPKYGIDVLIHAISLLIRSGISDIEVQIAGVGWQKDELVKLSEDLGVSKYINFLGWVENDKVPEVLDNFDIYVAPSTLDSESFGVAIVEASSCSLPVVVSNVGGLPEVVVNNKTGIVIEPNNANLLYEALKCLINNPEKRREFGENGRINVEDNYDWEKCLDKMIDVYKMALEK